MKTIARHSPNFNSRPAPVDAIVLHATASKNAQGDVEWCCSPNSKVSYHDIVDRDGTVYALVDAEKRAWHAGVSIFSGRGNCNDYSIGISFANDNAGEPYTDAQYGVGAKLVAGYMKRFPAITLERITTHAAIAPGRKTDPKGFDLVRFKTLVAAALAA